MLRSQCEVRKTATREKSISENTIDSENMDKPAARYREAKSHAQA